MDAGRRCVGNVWHLVRKPDTLEEETALMIAYSEACRGELGWKMQSMVTPDHVTQDSIFVQIAAKQQKKNDFYERAKSLSSLMNRAKLKRKG